MTGARTTVKIAWIMVACLALSSALRLYRVSRDFGQMGKDVRPAPIIPLAMARARSSGDLVDSIVERNVFRPDRAGDREVADTPATTPVSAPPVTQRPAPTLKALVGGPPWSIVLEGIAGRASPLVLRQGDSVAGMKLVAVRRDTVLVRTQDTTWKLILRQP
jgi:hypothetical protein